jgi:hypothetical protein
MQFNVFFSKNPGTKCLEIYEKQQGKKSAKSPHLLPLEGLDLHFLLHVIYSTTRLGWVSSVNFFLLLFLG